MNGIGLRNPHRVDSNHSPGEQHRQQAGTNDYGSGQRDPIGKDRCTHCNRCVGRTPTSPLGCYDITRFKGATPKESLAAMVAQIEQWNSQDPLPGE